MKKKTGKGAHCFLPVMLCVLVVVTVAVTVWTSRMIQEELFDKQLSIAHQVKNNLDYRFLQHEEFANGIMMSVLPYLSNQDRSYEEEYKEYESISSQLTGYLGRGMISDINLYVPDEKMYSIQRDLFYPLSDLEKNEAYQRCLTPGIHWLGTNPVRVSFDSEMAAIACVLTTTKRSDFSTLAGALFLYISVEELSDVFEVDPALMGDVFLVDADGVTLAHPDGEYIGQRVLTEEEIRFLSAADAGCQLIGTNLMSFSRMRSVPWCLVVRTPMGLFGGFSTTGVILLAALWAVMFLFAGFIVIGSVNNAIAGEAVRTLQTMIWESKTPGDAQKAPSSPPRRGFLSDARLQAELKQTVREMEETIEKRYQEQLELANYRMQSLQSQIKPHFLYNTLDIIKWMVVEGKYPDSIWTINALSRYLRMSINRESNMVTLREEIELAKTYLDLIQKRFTGRFGIRFDLEEPALSCLLPRLILQPIVENSLIHGLLYCGKPDGRLEIRAWIEEDSLCIDIEDNGSGMDQETLDSLFTAKEAGGYGLTNIRTRLVIFGGASASIKVYSQPGVGTCVSLRIPAREEIADLPPEKG